MLNKKISLFLVCTISALNFCTTSQSFDKELKSQYILLYNIESDSILYSKNADKICYPASITKIMTFLTVTSLDKFDKNEKITIKDEILKSLDGTDSSLANLISGNTYSVEDLLKSMMILSGNDSASVLADYFGHKIGSGSNDFISQMNKNAIEMGCQNTHFTNPHGLHNDEHYSTCLDLLKIIKKALEIKEFREIVKTQSIELNNEIGYNTNKLLDPKSKYFYDKCYGIKTGHHDQAGFCLSSIAGDGTTNYICLCLKAPTLDENNNIIDENYAMIESRELYEWAFNNFKLVKYPIESIKFPSLVTNKFEISIELTTKLCNFLIPVNNKPHEIKYNLDLDKKINQKFPILAGNKFGSISFYCGDKFLGSREIVSKNNIKLSFWKKFKFLMKKFFC